MVSLAFYMAVFQYKDSFDTDAEVFIINRLGGGKE